MLKKAKTLEDIYNSFQGNKPLSEDEHDFFINIYDKKLKRFIGNIKRNEVYQNIFFIAGQSGNGKSSILNNLKRESDIFGRYDIRHFEAKQFRSHDNIDIVDILLIIGFDLLDNSRLDGAKTKKLKDEFEEKLTQLQQVNDNELQLTSTESNKENAKLGADTKVSTGFNFFNFFTAKQDFTATYTIDSDIREEAKKIYQFKTKDLLDIINSLIKTYKRLSNTDKEILFILDGLEKLNNNDSIDDIFTKDISILQNIECYKIVTMPIYLKNRVDSSISPIDFTMEIDKNTNKIKNINILKDVIDSRLENKELITPKAIEFIIEKSGGNIRQLLNIISKASTEALDILESEIIDIPEVESALEQIGGNLSTRVQFKSEFLEKVKENHKIDEEDKSSLAECLRDGLVYAYFNGQAHYGLNPIVKDLL
ncbi:hypothetical protein FJR48_06625 [Sulfurimonas lithotrophica]|uniref:Uncharacterized protein n=1 Tax=Sulfurimonas lithotrophica TaxID=2590022 RepID=A0A5P8P123_9BACT|nr:hypothetical protein [Sulfurimonas lithotrophica]QFR49418.1 hypothetical protein FJR48_06625 [Sulfurimonas lithotrophica]